MNLSEKKSRMTLFLVIYLISSIICNAQVIRTIPQFTLETIKLADNLILYENLPLNHEILVAQATTYNEALPVTYSITGSDEYFKINSSTGSIRIFSPIDKLKKYKFTIVATDSAPFPNQKSNSLTANVVIISSMDQAPEFNDDSPYYVSVLDISTPGAIIYDNIYVTVKNSAQSGIPRIYCDTNTNYNSDALVACNFFGIEIQMIDLGVYKCLVKLLKKLDFNLKKNFIISISAEINMKKSTSYLVVDVKNNENLQPMFKNPTYALFYSYDGIKSNGLEVSVINVNLAQSENISFYLSDPKNYFTLSNIKVNCSNNECTEIIQSKTPISSRINYSMNITFNQQIKDITFTLTSQINVIYNGPTHSRTSPAFSSSSYEFFIYENIEAEVPIRNASITVFETDPLSAYYSGFDLEVLNDDINSLNQVFDIVPNNGIGSLVACLKLRKNYILDFESGLRRFDLTLKAVSRSNKNLFSFTKIVIHIQDYNEFSPYFENSIKALVLNQPENYKAQDLISRVSALDKDGTDIDKGLVYSIIGPHQHKFSIDSTGQIRLLKKFDFLDEEFPFYNLTILAYDQAGLSNFTNLILYFNITKPFNYDKSKFKCSLHSSRSELNLDDKKTLIPELYVPAYSTFKLKYLLDYSKPKIDELEIEPYTGRIYLKYPLNSTILNSYEKIMVKVRIYQVQPFFSDSLYWSSISCYATIYLKSINQICPQMQEPYFLREYMIEIDRYSVFKKSPLVKVEAISMNPNSLLPLQYHLINDPENLFSIDIIQGLIYPIKDFGLEYKDYELIVKATDPSNGLFSITSVSIKVNQKSKSSLICGIDYLVIKLDSNNLNQIDQDGSIYQLNCFSNSTFKDSNITYDISPVQKSYDCQGYLIDYKPNIGIDSNTGRIFSFEKFSRENFCDASFSILVRKDDTSISIPFKIVLLNGIVNKSPIFLSKSIKITSLSNYAYIGSYLTTVTAYDPVTSQLIEKYSIVSEKSNPSSLQKYFKIDSLTGVITLNNLPFVNNVELVVSATSNQGLVSFAQISIDLSTYFVNFYTNIHFDPFDTNNSITLYDDRFYYDSIYKANVKCFSKYDLSKQIFCGQVDFSFKYLQNNQNDGIFLIDKNSGNIYLSTLKIGDQINRSEFTMILNARSQLSPFPDRFIRENQKQLLVNIRSFNSDIPLFERNNYIINLYDNIAKDSNVLTVKYSLNSKNQFYVSIEKLVDFQIENFFYLKHIPKYGVIYLMVKSSPIPTNYSNLSFNIQLKQNTSTIFYKTRVDIKILSSVFNSKYYPIFTSPDRANYLIVLDKTSLANNSQILELRTLIQYPNQLINFNIMNKHLIPFIIEGHFLKIIYPFPHFIDLGKTSYLLFIEAKDIFNKNSEPSYITIDIRIGLLINTVPYFKREPTSSPISLSVFESATLNQSLLNLKDFIYSPTGTIYFYIFDRLTNLLSDTFIVNSTSSVLQIQRKLDSKTKKYYEIFIYVSDCPIFSVQFNNPLSTNIALLYINIRVLAIEDNIGVFIQSPKYIILEEIVGINENIGLVKATSYHVEPIYEIFSCDLISKSIVYKDSHLGGFFKIDSKNGIIFTNNSNFVPFKNNYFLLRISASFHNHRVFTDIIVLVGDYQEKSRLVLTNMLPKQEFSFTEFEAKLNFDLFMKYNGKFLLKFCDYLISYSYSSNSDLEVCFYIINTAENFALNFKSTEKILYESESIRKILQYHSVSKIERCLNRQDLELNSHLYDKNGIWMFNSFSIGLLVLIVLLLVITILTILILQICWASFMRQTMLVPSIDLDSDETDSNSNF